MKEKILEIILSYTYAGKIADDKFIYDICNIIIEQYKLDDYVKSIIIVSNPDLKGSNNSSLAEYVYYKRKYYLIIYLKKYFEENFCFQKMFSQYQGLFYMNLSFAEVLCHELEHAYQEYLKDFGESLESQILQANRDPFSKILQDNARIQNFIVTDEQLEKKLTKKSKRFEDKASKLYVYDPKERLAHLKSKALILEIAQMAQKFPEVVDVCNRNLNFAVYNPYDSLFSPTIYFAEKMHLIQNWQQFSWYHKNPTECLNAVSHLYPFSERLLLGLPISPLERSIIYNEYQTNKESSLIRKKD